MSIDFILGSKISKINGQWLTHSINVKLYLFITWRNGIMPCLDPTMILNIKFVDSYGWVRSRNEF